MTMFRFSRLVFRWLSVLCIILPLLCAKPLTFTSERTSAPHRLAAVAREATHRLLHVSDEKSHAYNTRLNTDGVDISQDISSHGKPHVLSLSHSTHNSEFSNQKQNFDKSIQKFEAASGIQKPQDSLAESQTDLAQSELQVERRIKNSGLYKFLDKPGFVFNFKAIACTVCKAVVMFVHTAFTSGWSEDKIMTEALEVCLFLGQEDERVCAGLVQLFHIEAITVFDDLILEPEQICGLAFGEGCADPYYPFASWNITLPDTPKPPVVPPVLPKPGSPTLRALHLTDIHMDTLYTPNATAVCGEPLCCRADDGHIGPFPKGAGFYGDYRNCDTPVWTLSGLFSHLNSQKFDYIIWTGDLPAHNIWNQTRLDQTSLLFNLTAMLEKYFPGKPVFPALGNHESSPVDSFPPREITGNQSIAWLYNALADSWKGWLPADALKTVRMGGYYTVTPYPGFRIISLNTNVCNNMNWWLYLNTTDPDNHLEWLITVLQKAEDAKEKVHIIGHIPPGISDCLGGWSRNYYNIVDRYESTITGQFYGHTHFDHIEIFYDVPTLKRPTNVAYISPSVTPYSNLNMGYRIFTFDGHYTKSSWEVLDHETYILNLTAANEGKAPPVWQLEYTAKTKYGMKSLFSQDWDDLIVRMEKDDQLFQSYYQFYFKSNAEDPCDADCKKEMLCEARSARSSGFPPGFCAESILKPRRKKMC